MDIWFKQIEKIFACDQLCIYIGDKLDERFRNQGSAAKGVVFKTYCVFHIHTFCSSHTKLTKINIPNSIIVYNFHLSISVKILFPKLLFSKLGYNFELLFLSVSKKQND